MMIQQLFNFNFHTLFSRICGVFTYCILTIFNLNPLKDTAEVAAKSMQTTGINIVDELYLGTIRMAFGIATAVIIYYVTKKKNKNG